MLHILSKALSKPAAVDKVRKTLCSNFMVILQHLRLGNDFHVLYFHLVRRTINVSRSRKKELKLVFISVTTVLCSLLMTNLVLLSTQ